MHPENYLELKISFLNRWHTDIEIICFLSGTFSILLYIAHRLYMYVPSWMTPKRVTLHDLCRVYSCSYTYLRYT